VGAKMKSKSVKFKLIIFAILSIIAIVVIITDNTVSSNIVINDKAKETDNKNEIIRKQELVGVETSKQQEAKKNEDEKQQQIKMKQEELEKKWKLGYDEFFEKKYEKAIETQRQVIKEDPNFYKAYAVEGIALAYNGDFEKGMQQIDKALELKPDYGYARFNKALANELYNNYDEAIKWYEKALEVEKFEWSYYGIASVYGRKGDVNNTVKYLKLAIDINQSIKDEAKGEKDFDKVKNSAEFKQLIEK
jgi:tetratricopeptide (TPR) repeat protein